jgi:soluble lytic murein transglycosylase-like protein
VRIVLTTIMVFNFASTARAFCFEQAGKEYDISPRLLWAIAKNESNFRSQAVNYNKNGTFDYGEMQINSGWYKKLGHERWVRLNDPCYNVRVGAWILSQCIKRHGYNWVAVGCYNSTNKDKGVAYANKVMSCLVCQGRLSDRNRE